MTCDATVHQCGDEVLAKYVAHLVEQDTISPLALEKISALLGSALHGGNSLVEVFQQASACTLPTVLRRGEHGQPPCRLPPAHQWDKTWDLVNLCAVMHMVAAKLAHVLRLMRSTSLAFHDAIELGHQYSVSVVEDGTLPGPSNALPQTVVQPFGYLALVHARGAPIRYNLALETARGNCRGVFQYGAVEELMPWVLKDSLADRGSSHSVRCGAVLVVEVVTRDVTSGTFLVSGLSRVQCGFSFPVSNAPRQYDVAMEAAVAAHCGVLEIGPSMAGQEAMPWSLKEAFSSGQSAVAIAGCLITNSTQFLNQSHLHIHTSFIPGAGQFPDCLTRLYNTRASPKAQLF
eukprot:Em0320g5a